MNHTTRLPNLFTLKPSVNSKRSGLVWPHLSEEVQPWTGKTWLCEPLADEQLLAWCGSNRFDGARSRLQWVMDNPSVVKIWPDFLRILEELYSQSLLAVMKKSLLANKNYGLIAYDAKGYERVFYAVEAVPLAGNSQLPYEETVSASDPGIMARKKGRILPWGEPFLVAHELRLQFYRCIERAFEQRFAIIRNKLTEQDLFDLLDLIHCKLIDHRLHPEQLLRDRDYLNRTYLWRSGDGAELAA